MKKVDLLSHNWLLFHRFQSQLRANSDHIRGHVVDLGCGERHYESFLLEYANTYFGVDWTNSLHCQMMDLTADLNQVIPLHDRSADTIVSISVLEHLSNPGMLISESFRLLRPGGWLILQVPFQWGIHEAPYDYFRFTQYGLRLLLSGANFEHIEIMPTTGFWTTWVLKLNYHSLRWLKGPAWWQRTKTAMIVPFWFGTQVLALILDRRKPNPEETQGYLVLAMRPKEAPEAAK